MATNVDLPSPREVAASLPPAGLILPDPGFIPTVSPFTVSKAAAPPAQRITRATVGAGSLSTANTNRVQNTGLGPANLDPTDALADDPEAGIQRLHVRRDRFGRSRSVRRFRPRRVSTPAPR
jgi:hypothetical protein